MDELLKDAAIALRLSQFGFVEIEEHETPEMMCLVRGPVIQFDRSTLMLPVKLNLAWPWEVMIRHQPSGLGLEIVSNLHLRAAAGYLRRTLTAFSLLYPWIIITGDEAPDRLPELLSKIPRDPRTRERHAQAYLYLRALDDYWFERFCANADPDFDGDPSLKAEQDQVMSIFGKRVSGETIRTIRLHGEAGIFPALEPGAPRTGWKRPDEDPPYLPASWPRDGLRRRRRN